MVSHEEQQRTAKEAATVFAHHERVFREQMHATDEAAVVARYAAPETLFGAQQHTREAAEAAQAAQARMDQAHQHAARAHPAQAGAAAEPVAAATEIHGQEYQQFLQYQQNQQQHHHHQQQQQHRDWINNNAADVSTGAVSLMSTGGIGGVSVASLGLSTASYGTACGEGFQVDGDYNEESTF